jgi:hypothetical protein
MASQPRSLLLMSPHFPPDSAAGTHRARILAPHLAKFGWRPTVLTIDPAGIEGERDQELGDAIAPGLGVIRVKTWSPAWTRRAGFGDLGLRAYRGLQSAARQLVRDTRVDAVLVTTYPTYPAMIGASLKRSARVPFVLDLQDPWVGAWGESVGPGGVPNLRSRASRRLAVHLERRVAEAADGLMSVTTRTIDELVQRVPAAAKAPRLEVPFGWEPADWVRVRQDAGPNGLFDPHDGNVHVCAVGTLLPTATDALRAFLQGVRRAAEQDEEVRRKLRVWFVGSSNERRHDAPAIVRPLAQQAGVDSIAAEHPSRFSYFDALRVLQHAHAVLVLGSGEPHYTPSRVFPALASRRPIIARLHPASPASQLLQSASGSRPVHLIAWSADENQQALAFAEALTKVSRCNRHCGAIDDGPLAPFTGEALAQRVATLLDRVAR